MKKHCHKCTMSFAIGRPKGWKSTPEVRCPKCFLPHHESQTTGKDGTGVAIVWTDDPLYQLSAGEFVPILKRKYA
jgi:hypothetical protein